MVKQLALGARQFHIERHGADGVCRTTEARIEASQQGFNPVQRAVSQLACAV